jgi:hypothetical protein
MKAFSMRWETIVPIRKPTASLKAVLWIRLRIGSGSRKIKMTQKYRKKLKILSFEKLDVLF